MRAASHPYHGGRRRSAVPTRRRRSDVPTSPTVCVLFFTFAVLLRISQKRVPFCFNSVSLLFTTCTVVGKSFCPPAFSFGFIRFRSVMVRPSLHFGMEKVGKRSDILRIQLQ